jgi:hypothetical protein
VASVASEALDVIKSAPSAACVHSTPDSLLLAQSRLNIHVKASLSQYATLKNRVKKARSLRLIWQSRWRSHGCLEPMPIMAMNSIAPYARK